QARRQALCAASVAILLDARGAKAGKAVFVDGSLPRQEFLDRQLVALTGFLKAQQAAANGSNHFGLASDDPAPRIGWRQVRYGQRTPIGTNDILDARSNQIGHRTLYINSLYQSTRC